MENYKPYKPERYIGSYVAMHEYGTDMATIKNQMLRDDFCPKGSLGHYASKILKASTRGK